VVRRKMKRMYNVISDKRTDKIKCKVYSRIITHALSVTHTHIPSHTPTLSPVII
jgi:hypothetical protein